LTAYVVVVKLLWQLDAAPAKAFLARLGLGNGIEALLALIPLGLLAWGISLQHKRHRIGFTLGVLAGVALSGIALVLYVFFLSWALSSH
jgi:hypothetical protein